MGYGPQGLRVSWPGQRYYAPFYNRPHRKNGVQSAVQIVREDSYVAFNRFFRLLEHPDVRDNIELVFFDRPHAFHFEEHQPIEDDAEQRPKLQHLFRTEHAPTLIVPHLDHLKTGWGGVGRDDRRAFARQLVRGHHPIIDANACSDIIENGRQRGHEPIDYLSRVRNRIFENTGQYIRFWGGKLGGRHIYDYLAEATI